MRLIEVFILLAILSFIFYGMVQAVPLKPTKLTIPDHRIESLESRVSALESWAQRQGMKYKGEKE